MSRTGTLLPGVCLGWLAAAALAPAQIYNISTFAGGAPIATPSSALQQAIEPTSLLTDAAGNFYFTSGNSVYRVDSNGTLTRVAGNGRAGYSGDGGQALSAQLNNPSGLAFDGAGNLLIGDPGNFRVRRVSQTGIIATIAGNGTRGNAGDEGPAVNAQLDAPTSVVTDAAGNVYIGDNNYQGVSSFPVSFVRRVSLDGIIHRVAPNTTISGAAGLAIDQAGNLLIADIGNSRILKVSPDGAGAEVRYSGRPLIRPHSLAVDSSGNIFIGDQGQLAQCGCYGAIREVLPDGTLLTLAGGGQLVPPPTPAANTPIQNAAGVALNGSGLLVADGTAVLALANGQSSVVAGSTTNLLVTPAGDGGAATNAQLALIGIQGVGLLNCVAGDRNGNVYIAENSLGRIRKVSGGIITTFADQVGYPSALAFDAAGNLYVNDTGTAKIRRISTTGVVTTVLSYGVPQYSVNSMAIDDKGNIFFTDPRKYVVRKLATDGTLTVIAGTGEMGFSGDGGPATQAQLYDLRGIALDSSNIYFADGNRVRKVSADGTITTVAGGDTAPLGATGLVTDNLGNLFITDGHYVKTISPGGAVTTIAGVGTAGYSGDGGPGTNAQLSAPGGLAIDAAGNLYVADTLNNAVRLLHPTGLPIEISAIVDAANETATPVSPGRIVVIYGAGLGPVQLAQFSVSPSGTIAAQLAGTTVTFNGVAAPLLYTSASQVAAIVPYSVSGFSAQVRVTYQGASADFNVLVTPASPTLFTANETGAGQAAAVNLDGAINSAAKPVKIGGYISLYATGEGQTSPAGADGKLAGVVLPHPNFPVSVTIGGVTAAVTYAGAAPGEVAGLMQVNVIVPEGVQPGGYVPVSVRVGAADSQPGVTIAVSR